MSTENNLVNYFRENVMTLLAVMMVTLLLVGYLLFGGIVLWPQWQSRVDLTSRLETAEITTSQLVQDTPVSDASPTTAAPIDLGDSTEFLTEQQAADFLNGLSTYAAASGVTISDLQTQPLPSNEQKSLYDVRQFRVSLTGDMVQLMDFVVQVRETAVSSIQLTNLQMTAGNDTATLTMDLQLYTSPYAAGNAFSDLPPAATPLPQPTAMPVETSPADALAEAVHEPWSQEDWPAAIAIIEQLLAIEPTYPEMTEKLYAAHINYGFLLLAEGDEVGAQTQFEQALDIVPDGSEALTALQSLSEPKSTSEPTLHVVQLGETLFSIARQHGVTVDGLRVANNLSNNDIADGQELLVP